MHSQSLVEKYRPRKLTDVQGQSWAVDQLRTWSESPHPVAFIFVGGTGTGKTSTALALAVPKQHVVRTAPKLSAAQKAWATRRANLARKGA